MLLTGIEGPHADESDKTEKQQVKERSTAFFGPNLERVLVEQGNDDKVKHSPENGGDQFGNHRETGVSDFGPLCQG